MAQFCEEVNGDATIGPFYGASKSLPQLIHLTSYVFAPSAIILSLHVLMILSSLRISHILSSTPGGLYRPDFDPRITT